MSGRALRFVRATIVAAAVLSAYGVAQAFVGAKELATIPPTTRQPNLPISNALGFLGFAVTLVVYALLGRTIVRAGAPPRTAAWRGALVGLIAGTVSSLAQAVLQADFFRAVALAYGLPDMFATGALVGVVVLGPVAGAVIGAVLAWLTALLSRRGRVEEVA